LEKILLDSDSPAEIARLRISFFPVLRVRSGHCKGGEAGKKVGAAMEESN